MISVNPFFKEHATTFPSTSLYFPTNLYFFKISETLDFCKKVWRLFMERWPSG